VDSMVIQDEATPEFMKRARLIARSNAGAKSAFASPTTPGEMSDQELDSAVAQYQGGAKVIDGSQIPKEYGKSASYAGPNMKKDAQGLDYAQRRKAELGKRHDDANAYRREMLTDDEYAKIGGQESGISNIPGITGRMGLPAATMMAKNAREGRIAEMEAQAKMKAAGGGDETQLKAAELYAALLAMEKKGDLEPGTAARIAGVAGLKLAPGETPVPKLPGEKATGGTPQSVAGGPVPAGSPDGDAFYSPQFSFVDGFLQGMPKKLDWLLNGDPADRGVYGYGAQLRAQHAAEQMRRKRGG
jgi:hypothetical protein